MTGTVSDFDRLLVAGRSSEDTESEGIHFQTVIRSGNLAGQEQPTFTVSVDSGSTWYAIKGGMNDIAAALDQRLDGYRLEQEHALHSWAAGTTVNFVIAGLSAGAGAIATAFLSEIGKELWKAFKEILLSPAARTNIAERREPRITMISPIFEATASSNLRTTDAKEVSVKDISTPPESKAPQRTTPSKPRRGGGDNFSFTIVVDGWKLQGRLEGIDDAQAEELHEFLEKGPVELYVTACKQFEAPTASQVPTKLQWSGRDWEPSARHPSYRPAPRLGEGVHKS